MNRVTIERILVTDKTALSHWRALSPESDPVGKLLRLSYPDWINVRRIARAWRCSQVMATTRMTALVDNGSVERLQKRKPANTWYRLTTKGVGTDVRVEESR